MPNSPARPRTILILGGGVGGVVAAVTLRRALPGSHRIVLVDRRKDHLFAPSLLWLMTGRRTPSQIVRPLGQLQSRGIEVIQGAVESIDHRNRVVSVNGQSIKADHLVIALGAELAPEDVPGLAEAGHTFYTQEGAQRLHQNLLGIHQGRVVVLTATPAYKCPAAPYEAAMLIEGELRRLGVRDRCRIDLYAAEPGPMGVAGPSVTAAVRGLVEAKGIAFHPEHQVTSVDPDKKRLEFSNGSTAAFDLLAYVPPHRAPQVVREAGLLNEAGWIPVDRQTLRTRFEEVYAIGDITSIPLAMGKPLPKAGVFAHRQAEVVARNLAASILGSHAFNAFDGFGKCFVETGDGKAGIGAGNFYGEPVPEVQLKGPSRYWRWAKVAFEKWWFWHWF